MTPPAGRRDFLRAVAGAGVAAALPGLAGACHKDGGAAAGVVTFNTSTDEGALNLAYALAQLEAAFYAQAVLNASSSDLATAEQDVVTSLRAHEVVHRTLLGQALGGAAIPDLAFDFGGVNFGSRTVVLGIAKTLEDLGVGMYNSLGTAVKSAANLVLLAKIASVEARHASAVRDLLNPGTKTFAGDDVIDANGLDILRDPAAVIAVMDPYVATELRVGT